MLYVFVLGCCVVTLFLIYLMNKSYHKKIELSIQGYSICKECLEEHREALEWNRDKIEEFDELWEYQYKLNDKLVNDIDLLSSYGQVPIKEPLVKSAEIPKPNHNLIIESDDLPLRDHGLVVGKTKSGKSNVLNSLIIRSVQDNQEVRILDVKREMGPVFGNHCVIIDRDDAAQAFIDVVNEADERQKIFAEASKRSGKRIANLDDYHNVTGDYSLRHVKLVVEEWMYLNEDGIDDSQLIKAMVICRSAGIWLLVALQLLRNDTMSRKASINFGFRVFLGPYDTWAFKSMFDGADEAFKEKAKKFLGKSGKAVVSIEGELETRTMPFIEDEVLEEWINA